MKKYLQLFLFFVNSLKLKIKNLILIKRQHVKRKKSE